MHALLLIDIQMDFLPGGTLAVPAGDEIIPLVNALQNSFDLIVATQDWHPRHHKSFASQHPHCKPFERIMLHGLPQVLWPDHCIQGSAGADFHAELDTRKVEAIFRKGMDSNVDSYSGFYDNGYRKSTGLAGFLRERKVTKVFVCGLAADYCVFYTTRDALKENFQAFVIEDATRPIDAEGFERAKAELRGAGGQVIQSHSLHRHL